MTCSYCVAWCARTEKQLANRLENIRGLPEAQTYRCPSCHGIEWATTRERIGKRRWTPYVSVRLRNDWAYSSLIPLFIVIFICLMIWSISAFAHDKHYAISKDMKQWFDGLRSSQGPCCSDADGTVIQDADWESHDNHYRVHIEGKWIEVPDEAVINEPNRYGPTMVWPIRSNGQSYGYGAHGAIVTIRCFMPGSMG